MNNLSVNEVIEFALNIERNGRDFYETALQRKDLDAKARELITMLRNEEINHESYFKTLGQSDDLAEFMNPDGWNQTSAYLNSIVKAHIFTKPGAAIALAGKAESVEDILKFAIQFEKDTLLYFHSLKEKTNSDAARNAINSILNEEVKHLAVLQDHLEAL
jgi:rubrerythrin